MTTVNKFDKAFKVARKHDEDRSRALQTDCSRVREGSAHLKSLAAVIEAKLDSL